MGVSHEKKRLSTIHTRKTYMPFLLTLVTGLVLVGVPNVDASLSGRARGRQAVPADRSINDIGDVLRSAYLAIWLGPPQR